MTQDPRAGIGQQAFDSHDWIDQTMSLAPEILTKNSSHLGRIKSFIKCERCGMKVVVFDSGSMTYVSKGAGSFPSCNRLRMEKALG